MGKNDMAEEQQLFKRALVVCAEVCSMRRVGVGVRKGSEWGCENVSVGVVEKKCGCRGRMRVENRKGKLTRLKQVIRKNAI